MNIYEKEFIPVKSYIRQSFLSPTKDEDILNKRIQLLSDKLEYILFLIREKIKEINNISRWFSTEGEKKERKKLLSQLSKLKEEKTSITNKMNLLVKWKEYLKNKMINNNLQTLRNDGEYS